MFSVADTMPMGAAADAAAFLRELGDPARPLLDCERACMVVAHPDDETIACGGQLRRLAGVTVAVVTDGAPVDLADAHANGCATAEEYAELRDRELRDALSLAGAAERVVRLGIRDQTAVRQLGPLTRRLAALFDERDVRIVLTHVYEGGHPDHDAVAFAVHGAATLLRRNGRDVVIVEMPLYYPTRSGWVTQRFVSSPGCRECVVPLNADERAVKVRMIAAHASQQRVLAMFAVDAERFRLAPEHDFSAPPRADAVWYHGDAWGLTGPEWLSLARAATRELGREAA